nr:arsenate reductase ArsC [Blautia faecis]
MDIDYHYETYRPELQCEGKPRVAFICGHNSCRSQIAEALGKRLASDVFESYSAGTELKSHINPDAVRLMKQVYGIDMEQTQYNKLISDIPEPDVVIFMGCNVSCPNVPSQYAENWGLDDPSGGTDEVFLETIRLIEENIIKLKEKLR